MDQMLWESKGAGPPPPGSTGLYHFAILYPTRAELADALRRLMKADVPLEGASDHGVSEALYLRDPDGNGVELYWDRPRDQWPRASDGSLKMITAPLDLGALAAAAEVAETPVTAPTTAASMKEETRRALRDMRGRLLHLHKVLLD